MLRRLYLDNFRCMVNFELVLGRVNLLLGENGSGKTTVFDAVHRLREFVGGKGRVSALFPSHDLTRWQTLATQRFEMDVEAAGVGTYQYRVAVEHDDDRRRARVLLETLLLDGRRLFHFEDGTAQLYRDDFSMGPSYPFDWTQSGIATLQPRGDNQRLTRFREEVRNIIIASPQPVLMASESREDDRDLSRHMENFASWYRYVSQEHQGAVPGLFHELRAVIPGFQSFSLKEAGESRLLKVMMDRPGGGKALAYDFGELSDGQRVLGALHALRCLLKGQGATLFLDEPDNFVALREIQPWLTSLTDDCGEGIEQAVLISHHPEIIDQMAMTSGRWFDRENGGPVRVHATPPARADGLKPSEAMARGWNV